MITTQNGDQISCGGNDISYNFVIGTYGMVFEGRGFDVVGASVRGNQRD